MRAFTNYNEVKEYTDAVRLPAGAYKIRIIRAEEQEGSNNSCALCLLFDIAEGEFKDYFMNRFNQDKKYYSDTAKYKGVFRLWYPSGNKFDESNERRMKTALKKITDSNSHINIDFTKEWDGALLKGALVGMIFRDQEYDYNGHNGFTAQPYSLVTLNDLQSGNFTIPEPKYLSGSSSNNQQTTPDYVDTPVDDDLPF